MVETVGVEPTSDMRTIETCTGVGCSGTNDRREQPSADRWFTQANQASCTEWLHAPAHKI